MRMQLINQWFTCNQSINQWFNQSTNPSIKQSNKQLSIKHSIYRSRNLLFWMNLAPTLIQPIYLPSMVVSEHLESTPCVLRLNLHLEASTPPLNVHLESSTPPLNLCIGSSAQLSNLHSTSGWYLRIFCSACCTLVAPLRSCEAWHQALWQKSK